MFLVDTSIWIEYLRSHHNSKTALKKNPALEYFIELLNQNRPFCMTGIIYQEILQGAASEKDMQQLISYLGTQIFFNLKDPILSYQAAAKIYWEGRRQGVTIRNSIDCIIAQVAIEHDLILLHNDRDYLQIKKVAPKLKLVNLIA